MLQKDLASSSVRSGASPSLYRQHSRPVHMHLDVTSLLQVPVNGKEWEGKEEAESTEPTNGKGDSLGLDWEWQVGVDTQLWSTEGLVQGSSRDLKVSGGLRSSQSDSGNHCMNVFLRIGKEY